VNFTKTCLHTLTPDRDFLPHNLPGQRNARFAVGSGHAFKFASHLGRILSELALDKPTSAEIDPFRADRETLKAGRRRPGALPDSKIQSQVARSPPSGVGGRGLDYGIQLEK